MLQLHTRRVINIRLICFLLIVVCLWPGSLRAQSSPPAQASIQNPLGGEQYAPTKLRIALAPGTTFQAMIRWTNSTNNPEQLATNVQYLAINNDNYLVPIDDNHSITSTLGETIKFDPPLLTIAPQSEQAVGVSLTVPSTMTYSDYLVGLGFSITGSRLPNHQVIIPILIHVRDPATVAQFDATGTLPTLDQSTHSTTHSWLDSQKQQSVLAAYRLVNINAPKLVLRHLWQKIQFENTGNAAVNAQAIIAFSTAKDIPITQQTVTAPLLMPKTNRTIRAQTPALWVETSFGRLPYIGPIHVEAKSLGNQPTTLHAITWLIPWWMLTILLLATIGLVSRVLAFHPRAPHRPYLLQYQGRLSLTLIIIAYSCLQFFIHSRPVLADTASQTMVITHVLSVLPITGFQIFDQGTSTIINLWTNQPLQINTPDKIYLVTLGGQAPILLPKGTPISFIAQL